MGRKRTLTKRKKPSTSFSFSIVGGEECDMHCIRGYIDKIEKQTNKQKQTKKQQLILNLWPQMPSVDEHGSFPEKYGR